MGDRAHVSDRQVPAAVEHGAHVGVHRPVEFAATEHRPGRGRDPGRDRIGRDAGADLGGADPHGVMAGVGEHRVGQGQVLTALDERQDGLGQIVVQGWEGGRDVGQVPQHRPAVHVRDPAHRADVSLQAQAGSGGVAP
ncbi:MAG: hypothetical protein H7270_02375, partial [Dermatophilaceae bacterium]|nr:hypothetical protein [Dermatophilaceae bacterium]